MSAGPLRVAERTSTTRPVRVAERTSITGPVRVAERTSAGAVRGAERSTASPLT